jgi:hypothetical protein
MFELTNIRSDDRRAQARAEAYLIENPDPGVRVRPQAELDRAMDTGQGLLLCRDGKICGISLIYKFDIPPSGPVFSEIGTMRITANGFGLQVFLAKFHLLQIRLEEFEDGTLPNVFAVVAPQTASAHNMRRRAGMTSWSPPRELDAVRSTAGLPFAPGKDVLIAGQASFDTAVSDLREWHQQAGRFRCPKGDDHVGVNLGWFDPEVLNIQL